MARRIHRNRLVEHLCNSSAFAYRQKMPSDWQGRFTQVPVFDSIIATEPWAYLTIIVKPSQPPKNGRKSSAHRTFVECACGKLVPTGRLHQHVCKQLVTADNFPES